MTSVGLVWSNLGKRKLRTALTAMSILVAFLLYGYLSAIKVALDGGNFGAGAEDRLVVRNRISITQPVPGTYGRRIAMIPGVTAVAHASWFGGIYQDPKNFFGQLAVVPEDYLRVYPEYLVSEDEKKAWFSTKNGAIAGRPLAEKYGWKVGDHIPLKATIWVKADGSNTWDFTLVGIYDGAKPGTDTNEFLFRYDYFDDAKSDQLTPSMLLGASITNSRIRRSKPRRRAKGRLTKDSPSKWVTSVLLCSAFLVRSS
jgi:putative ABC transport system permease protein